LSISNPLPLASNFKALHDGNGNERRGQQRGRVMVMMATKHQVDDDDGKDDNNSKDNRVTLPAGHYTV
jgi:hypothetical protein